MWHREDQSKSNIITEVQENYAVFNYLYMLEMIVKLQGQTFQNKCYESRGSPIAVLVEFNAIQIIKIAYTK